MKLREEPRFNLICYGVILLFFIALAAVFPLGLYGDSEQFISMHMHREPVYPLFLWVFRKIFGESLYLEVVKWAQNLINAFCAIVLLRGLVRRLSFGKMVMTIGTITLLAPHIMTPLFARSHLVLTCGVLNEALCLPLFYLYLLELISFATEGGRKHMVISAAWGVIISLIRGSMMICLIAWAIVAIGRCIFERKKFYFPIIYLLALFLLMKARSGIYIGYNYVVNGIAEANMCGNMNLVANVLYASDREAGERLEDEATRTLFYEIYDRADEAGLTYKHADSSLYNMVKHLENSHDTLKFDYILQTLDDYYMSNVGTDYVEKNRFQEETCKTIAHAIWPACFGRWLIRYVGLSVNGVIRSVAVVKPYTVIPAIIMVFVALGLSIYCLAKRKHVKAALALLIILMMLAANACGVATVIMCISRYMIYCFAPFYMGFTALLMECFNEWRMKKNEL